MTDYNWEHGRRFHGYKEGSEFYTYILSRRLQSAVTTLTEIRIHTGYKFPNDEREQDRLDMFHHIFKSVLGGRLFLAPVLEGPLRVLDIGTGTGIWAIEFGM